MGAEDRVGAVQLNARLCGVSPPVTRRLVITEQASLAQLHVALQVAFGWSDEHLYVFQIRGWRQSHDLRYRGLSVSRSASSISGSGHYYHDSARAHAAGGFRDRTSPRLTGN